MNRVVRNILLVLVVASAASSAHAQVRVYAAVNNSQDIYVNQAFTYQVIIDGDNQPGQVDITPLSQFNPKNAGNQDVSQSSISIVNGRTTRNVTKRYVMNYSLTSAEEGGFELPAVTVTIAGVQYRTNPISINILKPGTTDKLELEVTLSEKTCYVGQPVICTIKFYRYANIGDYGFSISALNEDLFYIEDIDDKTGQSQDVRITRNGRDALLFTAQKVLIPKQPGRVELPASTVSADVVVGQDRSRDTFGSFFGNRNQYQRFMVSSEPLTLDVRPLPEDGKPAGFYGLVGRYSIEASASPTNVTVGEPITLTIKIGGSKFLKPIQWPDLEGIAELNDNFKMPSQKASPAIDASYKIFTQTLRASNNDVKRIPPIPLAFFDADKGEYVVIQTEPITLDVEETKVLTAADMEGTEATSVSQEVEAVKQGLSANYEQLDALENVHFSPAAAMVSPAYLVVWAMPLAVLLFSAVVKIAGHDTPEKRARKRRRNASAWAIGQLKGLPGSALNERNELLASAMTQYIGDRFDKTAGSLTPDECHDIILVETGDPQLARVYKDILSHCEAARYASVGHGLDEEQIETAIKTIRAIEKKTKK